MLIGLTGRIGAGKETLTEFLRDKGFIYFKTSKLLKEELGNRGLEITRKNMQDLGDELREEYGAGVLMKMLLKKVYPDKNYIIDSLRNAGEVEFLRENVNNFVLIGVDAPQKLRYKRIIERGKESDPKIWEEFLKVDDRDFYDESNPLGQQVGRCMELADYVVVNDGDLKKSMKEIERIWEEIENNYYTGVIIEESFEDKEVLDKVEIIKTKVEKVTEMHKTPWVKQWTLHTVKVPENKVKEIAEEISRSLDSEHNWYADFKNDKYHFIIFKNKVFFIDRFSKEQYDEAKEYGILLGIPEYQVDFHPEVNEWGR